MILERGELQQILLDALPLERVAFRPGCRVQSVTQPPQQSTSAEPSMPTNPSPSPSSSNATTPPPTILSKSLSPLLVTVAPTGCKDTEVMEADIVRGADGLNSSVRSFVYDANNKPLPPPRDTGMVITYGLSHTAPFFAVDPGKAVWCFSGSQCYGTWAMRDNRQSWFHVEQNLAGDDSLQQQQAWSTHAEDVKERLKSLCVPCYDPVHLMDTTMRAVRLRVYEWPCSVLARGQTVLVGDAAHAMPPTGGQGGNLAAEDALVLANTLHDAFANCKRSDDITQLRAQAAEALSKYQTERLARTKNVQELALRLGQLYTSPNVVTQKIRRAFFSMMPTWATKLANDEFGNFQPKLKK